MFSAGWKMNRQMKGIIAVIAFLTAGVIISGTLEAQNALWNNVARHLDYMGYNCVVKDGGQRLYCSNQKQYPNFSVKRQSGGLLIISYWSGSEYAKQNRAAFLNLVNTFNSMAVATRYYVDKDSDLALEVWIPGEYEKTSFTNAVEKFNRDWDEVQRKFSPAIQQFIR